MIDSSIKEQENVGSIAHRKHFGPHQNGKNSGAVWRSCLTCWGGGLVLN